MQSSPLALCCMATILSSSLKSLPCAPMWHTYLFGETHKSVKRAPSFSVQVAAKGSDVSSDQDEHLPMKPTKKACHVELCRTKNLSSLRAHHCHDLFDAIATLAGLRCWDAPYGPHQYHISLWLSACSGES
ncbi:hypothetical protein EI94DRAFT_1735260 [Lactarius quietus]|nr:hypothetical protein EI94DRAFT_1735260 [Lactarius quietus]